MFSGFSLKDRLRASLLHFLISFLVIGIILAAVFWLWFQSPIFYATGFLSLVWLICLVDICAGPAATFAIWRRDKPGLKMDMAIIGLVQVLFFSYGIYTLVSSRPVAYVFVVDDFELVSASGLVWPDYPVHFDVSIFSRPIFLGANYSQDPDEKLRQQEAEMFDGVSLAQRPETYVSIESRAADILERAKPIEDLQRFNQKEAVVSVMSRYPKAHGYLPLKAPEEDLSVLIDDEGKVISLVRLAPW